MKTIEERAMEYAPEPLNDHYAIPAFIANENKRQAYIAGATDQKVIDKAELLKLKSAWEKEAQTNHDDEANYKQGYHDAAEKACKLIDNYIADVAIPVGWADAKLIISIPKRLRQAMEELQE